MVVFYNHQSDRVDNLAFEAIELLSEWNKLDSGSNDLLLKRYTQFGSESSPVISNWENTYKDFGLKLENLMNNRLLKKQREMAERLEGAYRVWRFTEVRLNNTSYFLNQIIQSGLGEKVMVNGMLYTMYNLRMQNQLSVSEICLLEEAIYSLEDLDNASEEFDFIFSSIVNDMQIAGEMYLKRIRILLIALFSSSVLVFAVSVLINRQLKNEQKNRQLYLTAEKEKLLHDLCLDSSEEKLQYFRVKQLEYGISISVDFPVLLILLQIDNFSELSHQYNLEEQSSMFNELCSRFKAVLKDSSYNSDYFRYEDEYIVFMVNVSEAEAPEIIEGIIKDWSKDKVQHSGVEFSVTLSDICFDNQDIDKDFEYLQKLSEYRFLIGLNAFIKPGLWKRLPRESFRYPLEKARHFEEALKTLNRAEAAEIMSDMVAYAEPFGPQTMHRLLLRLTASLSSVVEMLEKSYHVSVSWGFTPMILAIQKAETLEDAKVLLNGIIDKIIEACSKKKADKHDQTVVEVKEIVEQNLADLNLSAEQIAEHFKLTASYLNRLFKQHTTLSIAGYINEQRLLKAEHLISSTDHSIAHIAELSGFASMGTFFRLFKKKFGQTPGDMAAGNNKT